MTMKFFTLTVFLIMFLTGYGQDALCDERENILEHVKTVPLQLDAKAAAAALTEPFDDPSCKLYALYLWITEHIAYDYKTYNKSKGKSSTVVIKCKTTEECDKKWAAYREKQRTKTLKKRKGVCDDYAHLFQYMSKEIGISALVISGYTKTKPGQIGQMGTMDHAWNLIELDGKYFMIDATFGAGATSTDNKGKLNNFIKKRDDYYFMSTPERFQRTHFPSDKKIQELLHLERSNYQASAYIHGNLLSEIDIISPNSGVLHPKVGDTIAFYIKSKIELEQITVATSLRRQFEIKLPNLINDPLNEFPLEKNEDVYSFSIIITDPNTRFVDILIDRKLAIKFLVRLTK